LRRVSLIQYSPRKQSRQPRTSKRMGLEPRNLVVTHLGHEHISRVRGPSFPST